MKQRVYGVSVRLNDGVIKLNSTSSEELSKSLEELAQRSKEIVVDRFDKLLAEAKALMAISKEGNLPVLESPNESMERTESDSELN